MSLYELPTSTGGMDQAMVELISSVPSFIPQLLFFIFGVVLIGGITIQKTKTGFADFPLWTTMASISTLVISLILTMRPGFMNLETLAVVVSITIFSGLWLFLSKSRGEV